MGIKEQKFDLIMAGLNNKGLQNAFMKVDLDASKMMLASNQDVNNQSFCLMFEIDDSLYTRCLILINNINLTEKKFEVMNYLNNINMQQGIASFYIGSDNSSIGVCSSYRHINSYDGDVVVARMLDAFTLSQNVHQEIMKII